MILLIFLLFYGPINAANPSDLIYSANITPPQYFKQKIKNVAQLPPLSKENHGKR